MSPIDPFTQIHYAIWRALTNSPTWCLFVPFGARVNSVPANGVTGINAKPTIIKVQAAQPGDTPEVRIRQSGFADDMDGGNSKVLGFVQTFLIEMTISNNLLDLTPLNQLKWLTRCAMYKADPELGLPGLVKQWKWGASPEKMISDPDIGLKQWACLCPIQVWFYYSREAILAV